MAHEIEQFEDGTSAFFSARQPAWHTLGSVTPTALTAQEAIKVAQLDWQVFKSANPIQVPVMDENWITDVVLEDKFITYRDHPKTRQPHALGVVGTSYQVIQNSEAFDFLNYLTDDSGAVFETAGSLKNGKRVFISMKMPNSLKFADGTDSVDMYLLATNSHDGSMAFTAAVTPIRPVCTNTVRLAIRKAKSSFTLRHTSNVHGKIANARETMKLVFDYQDEFQKEVESLISASFTDSDYKRFVETLVPERSATPSKTQIKNVEQTRKELMALWRAPTQTIVGGTRWAAYNAVVEWADWVKPVSGNNGESIDRAERIMVGLVDSIKDKAYALLS